MHASLMVEDLDWSQYIAAHTACGDLPLLDSAIGEFGDQDEDALRRRRESELAAFAEAVDDDINDVNRFSEHLRRVEVIDWMLAGERPARPLRLRAALELRMRALGRDQAAWRIDPQEGDSRRRDLDEALHEVEAVGERLRHFSTDPLTPSPRRPSADRPSEIAGWQQARLVRFADHLASMPMEWIGTLGYVADKLRADPDGHERQEITRRFARQSETAERWQADSSRIQDAIGLARRGVDVAVARATEFVPSESHRKAIYWAAMDLATALVLKDELPPIEFEALWRPYEEAVTDLAWLRSTAFFVASTQDIDELLNRPEVARVIQIGGSQPHSRWDSRARHADLSSFPSVGGRRRPGPSITALGVRPSRWLIPRA